MTTTTAPAPASGVIDLTNWRSKPNNEWAFRNIDRLIKTQPIVAASTPSAFFPSKPWTQTAAELQTLETLLSTSSTDGFLVLHKGHLVTESYAHGNNEETKHIMMSMTKSVTGLVAGVLVSKGILNTEANVGAYVPETKGTLFENRTVRHFLDMRSGIQYDDTSHAYRYAFGWDPPHPNEEPSDFLKLLSNFHPEAKEPGGPFEYLSVNTDVLGLVLERASGKALADLISELIWQPIGAEQDAFITVDSKGVSRAAGGMCATVRDLARLGQALVSGSVVPESWIEDMFSAGDSKIFSESPWQPLFKPLGGRPAYRSCWVADGEKKVLVAQGIHGQNLFVDLEREIVVVKTSSQGHPVAELMSGVKVFLEVGRLLGS